MSHPSWVCGLKRLGLQVMMKNFWSHPSWVCGLKQHFVCCAHGGHESHPSWVCGLKQVNLSKLNDDFIVTSFVGVWIETPYIASGRSTG